MASKPSVHAAEVPVAVQSDKAADSSAAVLSQEQEDATIAFHFKLPANGLALRSAAVIDGVPELRFDASPKVPTITEEDVATTLRLASEGKRPEFVYIGIPESHPFYGRQFKEYSPKWLRGTSVGDLLSEADWKMKGLHAGVQSNKEKTKFWSWQNKSNLEGLAIAIDFPKEQLNGSIFMSCELAKVEMNDLEIAFPEEPKMKIVDASSSLYTKYITDIYPSVAYYDEPLFLKMQELIKLILVAEWLTDKKGVKISKQWMEECTDKSNEPTQPIVVPSIHEAKEPPRMLVPPQPTEIRRPRSDVIVHTGEAELQREMAKHGLRRYYGWLDQGSKEMTWFDKDGVLVEKNESMKVVIKEEMKVGGHLSYQKTGWTSIPIPPGESLPELPLPKETHEDHATLFGTVTVDVTSDDNVNSKDGKEMKVTRTGHPPSELALMLPKITHTRTVKTCVDDYNMLYSHLDPNEPISVGVSPNVLSWSELFAETVPWPHIMHELPDSGEKSIMGIASGGVSAKHIPVKEEPRRATKFTGESERVDQYIRRGNTIGVQACREVIYGEIRIANQQEFAQVSAKFKSDWEKGRCPEVDFVFVVTNSSLNSKWSRYQQQLSVKTMEWHYHGTSLACNITSEKKLCNLQSCGICGISSEGLKREFIRKNIVFQRFGNGFYLAPNSSKCHDYTQGAHGYRAMLLCNVLPGRKYTLETNSQSLTGPPLGYDSVFGQASTRSVLNFDELVIYKPEAVMPRYIIIYRKDGIAHPLSR